MKKLGYFILCLFAFAFGQKQGSLLKNNKQIIQMNEVENMEDSVVPKRLSYQGLLTKTNGQAVTDGKYLITFKLYDSEEGGELFWEEPIEVDINDGLINEILGDEIPIEKIPSRAYLEIQVKDPITEIETVLTPRQEMTSVFYAMVSDTSKYSQGGDYLDLDNRPDLSVYSKKDTLQNYTLNSSLDSVAFSGDYNDLKNLPNLNNLNLDTLSNYVMNDALDTLSNYVMNDALISLTSALSTVALSNNYNDLDNRPDLSAYTTSDTLSNFVLEEDLSAVAVSNDYEDLTNKPDLTVYATKDTLSNFVLTSDINIDSLIAPVNYEDLNNIPDLSIYATEDTLAQYPLSSSLDSVAFSGDYNDLENTPVLGVDVQPYDEDLLDLSD